MSTMRPQNTLSLPPDVVGAIFQFLKPAHVLDAAPTAKAWAEAGESKLVWDGLINQTVDRAVRDTLAVGGAPMHDAKADAAVRNALERCDQKSSKWAAKNPYLASAKARAWYAIGVALPPITAAVVAEVLPYRSVHKSNYRGACDSLVDLRTGIDASSRSIGASTTARNSSSKAAPTTTRAARRISGANTAVTSGGSSTSSRTP